VLALECWWPQCRSGTDEWPVQWKPGRIRLARHDRFSSCPHDHQLRTASRWRQCHRFRAPWRGCPYCGPGLVELCRCGPWAWKDGQDADLEHGRSQTTVDAFAGHGPMVLSNRVNSAALGNTCSRQRSRYGLERSPTPPLSVLQRPSVIAPWGLYRLMSEGLVGQHP
jgi:hypothetical protein